ncbi:MAG: efflux RND transporter periplasmic adaptor subunit [Deltaproteobacteria bacterium]|nr:efflux RND transporter periplasmic adaptor subunit [Deltaproteobacteria bacterium]
MVSRRTTLAPALVLTACAGSTSPPPAPRAVQAVVVAPRDAAAVSRYSGSLAPWEQVELSFAVSGTVQSIAQVHTEGRTRPLQEGDPVRHGDLLAALDDSVLRTRARAATATLRSAGAQLGATEAALAQTTVELERARRLRGAGTIPLAEYQRAEAAFAAARAGVEVARAQRLAAAEQSAVARSTAEDTRLVSPLDGLLARRLVDVGETVAPGTSAFTVINTSRLCVVFGVPGHQLMAMKLGRRLPVHIEGLPGDALVGTVSKVQPVADPLLRSFSVEVTIANPDNRLRPGMVASITTRGDEPAALLIPLESVVRGTALSGGPGFSVWVLPPGDGGVQLRAVELGDLHGNDVMVTAGLAPGDVVVTQGAQFIRAGERVAVRP